MIDDYELQVEQAASVIAAADALLIGAGAGMGVDSGLPDFRGDQGFWKAYPPFRGRQFAEMSAFSVLPSHPPNLRILSWVSSILSQIQRRAWWCMAIPNPTVKSR
jgi:NAD-dependent SIR2 family protein deacetylase